MSYDFSGSDLYYIINGFFRFPSPGHCLVQPPTGCEQSSNQTAREESCRCSYCQANVTHALQTSCPFKANSDGDSHDGVEVIKKKSRSRKPMPTRAESQSVYASPFVNSSRPHHRRTRTRNHSQSDDCRSHCCYPSSLPSPSLPHNTNTQPHPRFQALSFFCFPDPPSPPTTPQSPDRLPHARHLRRITITVGHFPNAATTSRRLSHFCSNGVPRVCWACACVVRACVAG